MMLTVLLLLAGFLTLLGGVAFLSASTTAIHEIEAFLLFIISAVCLSGVTVAEAVNRLRKAWLLAEKNQPARSADAS